MLTPLDIENREFKRTFTGYRRDDVEDFMSLILHDYERVYKENLAYRDKVELLTQAVNHYKVQEDTMKNSIVVAQKAADMLTHSSTENADLIVKEARIKAENIMREAQEEVAKIVERHGRLLQEVESYRLRSAAIIKAQLDILQDLNADSASFKMRSDIDNADMSANIIQDFNAANMSFNTGKEDEDVEDGDRDSTEYTELQSDYQVTAD